MKFYIESSYIKLKKEKFYKVNQKIMGPEAQQALNLSTTLEDKVPAAI